MVDAFIVWMRDEAWPLLAFWAAEFGIFLIVFAGASIIVAAVLSLGFGVLDRYKDKPIEVRVYNAWAWAFALVLISTCVLVWDNAWWRDWYAGGINPSSELPNAAWPWIYITFVNCFWLFVAAVVLVGLAVNLFSGPDEKGPAGKPAIQAR